MPARKNPIVISSKPSAKRPISGVLAWKYEKIAMTRLRQMLSPAATV